jgi:hypothetical protein
MRLGGWLSALIAALAAALAAFPQSMRATGAVEGIILDASGAAVPGAEISLVHTGTGAVRRSVSDGAGRFTFHGLPSGDYSMRVSKDGFTTLAFEPFPVPAGETVIREVRLVPAAVATSLEVQEQPEPVDVSATTAGASLGAERIEESPSSHRNYLNFVLVAPGVAASPSSKAQRSLAGLRAPNLDSGFAFHGLRGRNNGLFIDGLDNRDETTGGNRAAIGLEMVQEFRVAGAIVGAESGGASGGIVNVVTRSGANIWHGDATFFFQNELLNARNPEAAARACARRAQPGASILGPLSRDRTFFATAFEQQLESGEEWSDAPEGALEALNAALAGPQFAGTPVRQVRRGLFPTSASETAFSFKLDHRRPRVHAFSGRYAFSRGRLDGDVYGMDNFADQSARGASLIADHSLAASWLAVPSAHWVNDLRLQLARRHAATAPAAGGPMFAIPGVLTLGQAYNLDASRTEDHLELVEAVELATGRHRINAGVSWHQVWLDARLAGRFGGVYIFPTLADFLAGHPDIFLQAFGDPRTRLGVLPLGAWIQERWQPLPGLHVEAGLRFDLERLPAPIPGPSRAAAPRLGLAWRPSAASPWVLRAGLGLFYDRFPLAFLNDAIQKDGSKGFEQYLAGELAERAFSFARGGGLSAPLPGLALSSYQASARFPPTYSRKLILGAERTLGKDTRLVLETAFVRGYHLPRIRNAALALPPAYALEPSARSAYAGFTVSVNRRLRRELTYLLAYSAGRTLDDASDFDEHPSDPRDTSLDWALSRQHQAHRLAASALIEAPAELAPGRLRAALKDVVVAPILQVGAGRPLNALATSDVSRTGAFPISSRPDRLPRNPFRTPATATLDLRLMKGFWLRERRAILQAGVEAFNLLNHTNPLIVSPYYASGGRRLPSYGGIVEALDARRVQLLVQIEY